MMDDGHDQERLRLAVEDATHGIAEAAQRLEDEIERRGRHIGYVMALMRMLNTRQMSGMDEKWTLIRATPEQRARAFLAATERT